MITDEQLETVYAWVDGLVSLAQISGRPLTDAEREIAARAGVERIDDVRIQEVESMPPPPDSLNELAALYLDPRNAAGLTLGHVVLILSGRVSDDLLRHEFIHVSQVETLGGVRSFLRTYLEQIIEFGYQDAPLEVAARKKEQING